MKSLKFLHPVSTWLMRLGFMLYAYTKYWQIFKPLDTKNAMFYVALAHLLFGLLLLIGGFLKKPVLTVISGLIILLACGYQAYLGRPFVLDFQLASLILAGSIGLYFFANGNQ